ncbi:PTS sugar transporter subunit IIA [Oenococcus oeni]|uniref:PTS sugar transporter subunit IIA n=1 Tax=Oenococcus oeni TaxID=1247 RepID=UPI00050FC924|nr:PTS sugar transporter subunit IIA [Oenococcus oeni]KGI03204.1 PTS fructose transporter subunit IIA [Oenococcus oeni IOEB_C52]MDV7686905.1 PTS fructose transporter subunit IIA [Oenococcus oeni]OLQ38080.1 PTS fructose transporter subunit IIA [Oenococcus oeni]SYW16405.1 putative PTS system mannose/fructose-specific EIIA component [Oenococcus oeni]
MKILFRELNSVDKITSIKELSSLLSENRLLKEKQDFLRLIYEREKQGNTLIAPRIAMPHAEGISVRKTSMAIGKSTKLINWNNNQFVEMILLVSINPADEINNEKLIRIIRELGKEEKTVHLIDSTKTNILRELQKI